MSDISGQMQFGIFTVSDITEDPTTGTTPSEAERIRATLAIAKHAEEVGLDVFALGEHHNPPFWSSSPTTTLAYIAAQTERVLENMRAVLEASGSSFEKVLKTTVFLKDMGNFPKMNEVYGRYFGTNPPARSTVEAARLPRDVQVEIDCIAIAG